jgi:hypothetical protein
MFADRSIVAPGNTQNTATQLTAEARRAQRKRILVLCALCAAAVKLNGKGLLMFAGAGGGAGSTKNRPVGYMANNVYAQGTVTTGKGKKHQHGGPLPAGDYKIGVPYHDEHLGLCAALSGPAEKHYGRTGGFFIHGRGPHGSDGCIVPDNNAEFHSLMTALTKSKGGALHVLENMGDTRFA